MKIRHSEPHGPLRAHAYPDVGDQLDAIYEGFKAMGAQVELPQKTREWMTEIERIKAKYPKPAEPPDPI